MASPTFSGQKCCLISLVVSAKNTVTTEFRLTVLTIPAKETLNDVFDAQWPLCIRALISRWISDIEIHRIERI